MFTLNNSTEEGVRGAPLTTVDSAIADVDAVVVTVAVAVVVAVVAAVEVVVNFGRTEIF